MSELVQNPSATALMLVAEMLAAKEFYDLNRNTKDFEFLLEKRGKLETYITELEAEAKKRDEFAECLGAKMADVYVLKSRITELEGAQRWIPVSERLPEPKTCVLVYDAGGNMTVDFLVTSGDVEKYFWLAKYRIMFWMPLPTPPAVQE